ncbi:Hypothetical predicted protein [Cloeon dipterum]|uniref:Uncharacterized protein n=1 Tax=Cloeon dipterum TaxID=197152 RepID=A0A8S1DYW2_9INSE|nr:Hypothetical predicted protein [Cloeon dipterum]
MTKCTRAAQGVFAWLASNRKVANLSVEKVNTQKQCASKLLLRPEEGSTQSVVRGADDSQPLIGAESYLNFPLPPARADTCHHLIKSAATIT